jgi:nucleotide-binding universal stress UspA family protein
MFKKILVAVDGSPHSRAALEVARGLAETLSAELWIVHAYDPTSDLLGYTDFAQRVAQRKSQGQKLLDALRGTLAESPLPVSEELIEGPGAEAILKVADIRGADLIVMGTRGLGALGDMVLGSVTRKVTQQAACPVMLARASEAV